MGPSGDTGFTWGHYEAHGQDAKGQPISSSGRYITFWKKVNGHWKVALDASANDAPAGGAPTVKKSTESPQVEEVALTIVRRLARKWEANPRVQFVSSRFVSMIELSPMNSSIELPRLQALSHYDLREAPHDPALDDIARLAALVCNAPVGDGDDSRARPGAHRGTAWD